MSTRMWWKAHLLALLVSLPVAPAVASGDLFYFEAQHGEIFFTLMMVGREDPAKSTSAGRAHRLRRYRMFAAGTTSNSTAPSGGPTSARSPATACPGSRWTSPAGAATCCSPANACRARRTGPSSNKKPPACTRDFHHNSSLTRSGSAGPCPA